MAGGTWRLYVSPDWLAAPDPAGRRGLGGDVGAHRAHNMMMTHAVAAAMMVTSRKVVPHSLIAARISLTTSR
jgi:hypothetical protein